jgi:hypothetical protein
MVHLKQKNENQMKRMNVVKLNLKKVEAVSYLSKYELVKTPTTIKRAKCPPFFVQLIHSPNIWLMLFVVRTGFHQFAVTFKSFLIINKYNWRE